MKKYDDNGNCIYEEYNNGNWWVKYKYNQNNNKIYEEYNDGYIYYPYGKQFYINYINCTRKEKIKRILNENRI